MVFTVCYSIRIFLMKDSKVWPLCLSFRLITAKFTGVRKFRNFTVVINAICYPVCYHLSFLPIYIKRLKF